MAKRTCGFTRKNGKRCKNKTNKLGLGRYCRLHATAALRDAAYGAAKFGATTVAGGLLWEAAKAGIEATTGIKMKKARGATAGGRAVTVRGQAKPRVTLGARGMRSTPPATTKRGGPRRTVR